MNSLMLRKTVPITRGSFGGLSLLLLALAIGGCQQGVAGEPTPTFLPPIEAADVALAEGKVVPARYAALGFQTPGTVAALLVAEGDAVKKGQPLVRLESGEQAAAVLQADANLAAAKAELARLESGATAEELAAAEAAVDRARAVAQSAAGGVAQSRASLGKAQAGATGIDLAIARRRLEESKNALWGVQSARDAICGRADAECDQEDPIAKAACKGLREESKPGCDQAQANVQAAEEQVRIVELSLVQLQGGARPEDVEAARAGLVQAQGQYQSAAAGVREAEAGLSRLRSGATTEALAAARARVDQAEAALEQARLAMDATVLRAPFAGTVAALDARENEQVRPGVPAAYVADLSRLEIETDDLNEVNVVGVEVGHRATITFDAIPALTLEGKVARIRQLGENRQGDIVYKAFVTPDKQDARLRWNMTASVTIDRE